MQADKAYSNGGMIDEEVVQLRINLNIYTKVILTLFRVNDLEV